MNTRSQEELINEIVGYFQKNIFENHIKLSLTKNTKLKNYNINPIVVKYLSKILDDSYTPIGVAKALYFPRVLGTSINTSFGDRIQKMFIDLNIAEGSLIKGIDIEFIDKIDERRKYCQLKSGPNNINADDVGPIIKKFTDTINLARTNRAMANINNSDFILGVIYGAPSDLSMHYRKIDQTHPVIIGPEFWHRVTGFPNFYDELVVELHTLINSIDNQNMINQGLVTLSSEIATSKLFDFT